MASCSEESRELPNLKRIVFHAYTDPETRTQLSENDGASVYWSAREAITVFDGEEENYKFLSSNLEPCASVSFALEDNTVAISEPEEGGYFHALYPYDSEATLEDGIIHTTYPASFEITRYGSFEDNMNLAVARSSSYSLGFKNLLGFIRFGFTGDETINRIVFKGNNGEKLAGNVAIDVANLTTNVESGSYQLTLTGRFLSSVSRYNGHFYYIPLLPLSFARGFTVTFYNEEGASYTFSLTSRADFERGSRRFLWVDLAALIEGRGTDIISILDGNDFGTI